MLLMEVAAAKEPVKTNSQTRATELRKNMVAHVLALHVWRRGKGQGNGKQTQERKKTTLER